MKLLKDFLLVLLTVWFEMDKRLAKIKSASLEIKERNILNFWINVDYEDGLSQGIGGIVLDNYDNITKRRVGTAYGCEMIRRLLLTLNVNDFSEMKGLIIWVYGEGSGFQYDVKGISRLKCENYKDVLIFDDVYKEFGGE